MAALTAASWTVVITETQIHHKERVTRGTIEIPAVDTYPTGGIPLPTAAQFGMYRNLTELKLAGQDSLTDGYAVSFDKENHKLQLYGDAATGADGALLEAPVTDVPGPRVWRFEASGW